MSCTSVTFKGSPCNRCIAPSIIVLPEKYIQVEPVAEDGQKMDARWCKGEVRLYLCPIYKAQENFLYVHKDKKKGFKTVRFLEKGEGIEKRALDLEIPDGAWPKCQYRCLADSLCG
jgi:hypothetical protein